MALPYRLVKVLFTLLAALCLFALMHGCKKPAPVGPKTVEMVVTEKGFEPVGVHLQHGQKVTLRITRKTEKTCATEVLVDGTDIDAKLPLNQPVEVSFTPSRAGELHFGCQMGQMVGGVFFVD